MPFRQTGSVWATQPLGRSSNSTLHLSPTGRVPWLTPFPRSATPSIQGTSSSPLLRSCFYSRVPLRFSYGAYLSKEQVAELVSPHQDTLNLVRAWLIHHGIRPSSISMSHGGSWLTVTDVLVSQANQLLGASYRLYRHSKTNDTTIRTVGYALPVVLHTLIRTVAPTTYFPSRRGMRQTLHRRSSGAAQAQPASRKVVTARQTRSPDIRPSILRTLYKTETYKPLVPDRNMIGILGIDDDYPSRSDLAEFMARYRSDAIDADFTVKQWNDGGYNPDRPGVEASISIQYASAMAYPTPLVFYSVGGDAEWDHLGRILDGDMYLEWFWALLSEQEIPQTIIIPYGHLEQNLPIDYAESVCRLFGQLSGRGITVLVSSGNDGVGDGDCVNDIGNTRFKPEFPSSCTCRVFSSLPSSRQAQVQVAHQTTMICRWLRH